MRSGRVVGGTEVLYTVATSKDPSSAPRQHQALKLRVPGPQWPGEHFSTETGSVPRRCAPASAFNLILNNALSTNLMVPAVYHPPQAPLTVYSPAFDLLWDSVMGLDGAVRYGTE